jgi:hypothetical protein
MSHQSPARRDPRGLTNNTRQCSRKGATPQTGKENGGKENKPGESELGLSFSLFLSPFPHFVFPNLLFLHFLFFCALTRIFLERAFGAGWHGSTTRRHWNGSSARACKRIVAGRRRVDNRTGLSRRQAARVRHGCRQPTCCFSHGPELCWARRCLLVSELRFGTWNLRFEI